MKAHRVLVVSGSRESALTLCSGVKPVKKNPDFPPLSSTQPIVQTNITWYHFSPNLFHTPNPFNLSRGRWDVTHRAVQVSDGTFQNSSWRMYLNDLRATDVKDTLILQTAQHVLAPSELWNNCFYCTTKFISIPRDPLSAAAQHTTAFFFFLSFFLSSFFLWQCQTVYVTHIMQYLWPGVIQC